VTSKAGAKPRVLLVGGGPFQLEILRAAQRRAEVAVVDGSPHAPGLALADHARVIDIADSPAVVRVARELRVSGVVTAASDVAVPAVSAVVRELGLPGLSPEVALRCRDKLACFRALTASGHAVPATHAVSDDAGARAAVEALGGYPVIVKPRSGGGGRGVVLVRAPNELPAALACARRAYGPGQHGVLVQEFIGGLSVGVEAFFAGGELAEAFVLDDQFEPGYISPAGHALPPTLAPAIADDVVRAIAAFGRALGLRDGPANFDLRQHHGRTIMLEVNPRLGGNSITDLVRCAYGVDLAEATVAAALGQDPRPILQRRRCDPAAARLILKHAHGTAHISGPLEPLAASAGVLHLDVLVNQGEPAHVRVDEWTIVGRTMVRAADSGSAAALAERVAHEVAERITLVPVPQPTAAGEP
jgi:biotin carboxylase